ncbi:carbohydrate kinase family protein [Uliginosibacterium sp. H3]|uniref:Carbohydrate kinase family protein n=1 Tax=Uliginosibacterium silvisoli TaxID=3114758 RepID=A0ABU6K1Z4_9RHOO|nr:carbohydrate kinase family protein [Uliginosibacterium sp. H3]
MSILVCGSMAFDTIMVFQDQFKRHILPDQIHILNVSFFVPEMRREFGGCAGNIAYNISLLGGDARIMATVGDDVGPYRERLTKLKIDQRFLKTIEGTFTAQAFITTDQDNNQITAFHPGAMMQSHLNNVQDAAEGVKIGLVGPDGLEGMLTHCRNFAAAKVPFIFDPGQGLPLLSGEDLLRCIDLASYCTVNDYEAKLVCDKTGMSIEALAERVKGLIVTLGEHGSRIYEDGKVVEVACARAAAVVDPTGCGDAYRGGLLHGLSQGWTLTKSAKLASLMGAIKIAHRGGQNHQPSRSEIAERFTADFGETL